MTVDRYLIGSYNEMVTTISKYLIFDVTIYIRCTQKTFEVCMFDEHLRQRKIPKNHL